MVPTLGEYIASLQEVASKYGNDIQVIHYEPEYDGGRTPKRRKNGVVRKARAKTRNPKGLSRGARR